MAIIPTNLSAAQKQARKNYLQNEKQNWFKYASGGQLPWPDLDPGLIPVVQAQMSAAGDPDYWVSKAWQKEFDDRLDEAKSNIFDPIYFGTSNTLDEYPNLTQPYDPPNNVTPKPSLDSDTSFAGQRLWGSNPLKIRKVVNISDLPSALAIKNGDGPDGIKLDQAINDNRLYICDYSELGFLAGMGEYLLPTVLPPNTSVVEVICQKYLNAPIGLFYWDGDVNSPKGRLLPYAIQLEQRASAGVFTPQGSGKFTHGLNWRLAKAAFQAADAQAHEWDSHLMRTHVILAPFAISGERHLHPEHPVLVLMRPHLRYTLKINSETGKLTDQNSYGDLLLAPYHEGLTELLKDYYATYMKRGFCNMANLEKELADRNMTKSEAPIHYPYRDDGLPIFYAVREFVSEYISHYYKNDGEVIKDEELSAFAKELTSNSGGGVKKLTPNGNKIESLADLIDVLTNMIWTAGPAHAAVNYSQWDYMADPRNMPMSVYQEVPQAGNSPPMANHGEFFPQFSLGRLQAGLMYVLGTYRFDMLGHYRSKDFTDAHIVSKIIPRFQCKLAHIGGEIHTQDQLRILYGVTYPYLFPWLIPNSTSI